MPKHLANHLVQEYGTRDPIMVAEALGIHVQFEPLGKINGYFHVMFGEKFIHINQNMSEHEQIFTVAHELGHALMHEDVNILFLFENTYMSDTRYETEADWFAVSLLIDDETVEEMKHLPIMKLSEIFNVEPHLICYRFGFDERFGYY